MAYRGDDLDLRSAAGIGREPGDPVMSPGRIGGRSATLWVDDVVLAVVNDAYDLALAHRAGEVMIEHLLNAMTRIDAAAAALEASGVRVGALRRESGTIIASDIPVAFTNGKGAPKTSREVEDILRHAVDMAAASGTVAGMPELIAALAEARRDLPGLAVLRRHWTPRARPTPPPMAAAFTDETRERIRAPARQAYIAEVPRTDAHQALTDTVQNSRLDSLERLVRDLAEDLSKERQTMSGTLGDLQRAFVSSRDDTAGSRSGLTTGHVAERLAALERGLDARLGELARGFAALGERLQALEGAVADRRGDAHRLEPLIDRLQALERTVQSGTAEGARAWTAVSERVKELDLQPVVERLQALEARVAARQQAQTDLGPVLDRLEQIERLVDSKVGEAGRSTYQLSERLRLLEESLLAQRSTISELPVRLGTEVKDLAATLTAQAATTERMQTVLNDRLAALGAGLERQKPELAEALSRQIGEQLSAVAAALGERQAEVAERVRLSGERIGQLDAQLSAFSQKTTELQALRDKDLLELHEALLKINSNQQTLAGSFDQWRLEAAGDMGVLSNRLEAIERQVEKPMALVQQLQGDIQTMYAATLKREQRKSRWRLWMFGTEDWFGDSWGEPGSGRRAYAAAPQAPAPRPATGSVPPTRR